MQDNMTPSEIQLKAHREWLVHPVTQDFLKILDARQAKHTHDLQEGILVKSDSVIEEKLRNTINVVKAVKIICSDSQTFVDQQNKLNNR